MIDHETLRKLRELKLDGMATGFGELLGRAPPHDMTLSELVGTLVDREWSGRENRRLTRLLKLAKIGQDASSSSRRAPGLSLHWALRVVRSSVCGADGSGGITAASVAEARSGCNRAGRTLAHHESGL